MEIKATIRYPRDRVEPVTLIIDDDEWARAWHETKITPGSFTMMSTKLDFGPPDVGATVGRAMVDDTIE